MTTCMRYLLPVLTVVLGASPAVAADWKPGKPVEFVVPAAAGGGLDRPARLVQKIWQETKLVDVPVNVINKSGGGQSVGYRQRGSVLDLASLGVRSRPHSTHPCSLIL